MILRIIALEKNFATKQLYSSLQMLSTTKTMETYE